jgi:hypothetical protein
LKSPPLVTDYITHILYPIGTEIDVNTQALNEYCEWRERLCERQLRQQYTQLSVEESLEQQFSTPSKSNADRHARMGRSKDVCAIKLIGVPSIPANACAEVSQSEGQSCHRVFHPPSLVDTILDLANGGSRLSNSL